MLHVANRLIEPLERRALLAGNVSVFLDAAGNLIVRGESAANGIQVDQYGSFAIQGVDAGGAPTRVNGVDNDVAAFDVAPGHDIRITLAGGADRIEVGTRSDDVNPPRDLAIDTGDGSDSI